jgi:hypothetical protein
MNDLHFDAGSGLVKYTSVELNPSLRLGRGKILKEAEQLFMDAPGMAGQLLGAYSWEPAASWTGKLKLKDLAGINAHRWFALSHDTMEILGPEIRTSLVRDAVSKAKEQSMSHEKAASFDDRKKGVRTREQSLDRPLHLDEKG